MMTISYQIGIEMSVFICSMLDAGISLVVKRGISKYMCQAYYQISASSCYIVTIVLIDSQYIAPEK